MSYYDWDDFQTAICRAMGIADDKFRDYHDVVFPSLEAYSSADSPYYDCWHVWMSVFDENVRNDSYSTVWFQEPDEPGDKDGEWAYIEEKAVKEYGEWSRTFVKAVAQVVAEYDLADKEVVIYHSW